MAPKSGKNEKEKPKYVKDAREDIRGYETKAAVDKTKFNNQDSCPDCGADPDPDGTHKDCAYKKYYNPDGTKKPLGKGNKND